ncbi:MAG: recombinase family protein [Acidobacteria bacterium]|nr:recombinase family protein [Acidobacteriota bacterium]
MLPKTPRSKLLPAGYISAGNVSTLACWRLDRLGRTAKGLTALFDDLIQRKVNLVHCAMAWTFRRRQGG